MQPADGAQTDLLLCNLQRVVVAAGRQPAGGRSLNGGRQPPLHLVETQRDVLKLRQVGPRHRLVLLHCRGKTADVSVTWCDATREHRAERRGVLTRLHVAQQVLAVLLRLLDFPLQLPSFGRREQRALLAVWQEVGQLGPQVIQRVLALRRTLTANLKAETTTRGGETDGEPGSLKRRLRRDSPCPESTQRRSWCLWGGSATSPRSSCSHAADATETLLSGTAALPWVETGNRSVSPFCLQWFLCFAHCRFRHEEERLAIDY